MDTRQRFRWIMEPRFGSIRELELRLLTTNPRDIEKAIREAKDEPLRLEFYPVASAPSAADWRYGVIFVTDETGGATVAFSDGTNWRRVQDRAIIA